MMLRQICLVLVQTHAASATWEWSADGRVKCIIPNELTGVRYVYDHKKNKVVRGSLTNVLETLRGPLQHINGGADNIQKYITEQTDPLVLIESFIFVNLTCPCAEEPEGFENEESLRKHIKKIHDGEIPGVRQYKCGICAKKFRNERSHRQHCQSKKHGKYYDETRRMQRMSESESSMTSRQSPKQRTKNNQGANQRSISNNANNVGNKSAPETARRRKKRRKPAQPTWDGINDTAADMNFEDLSTLDWLKDPNETPEQSPTSRTTSPNKVTKAPWDDGDMDFGNEREIARIEALNETTEAMQISATASSRSTTPPSEPRPSQEVEFLD